VKIADRLTVASRASQPTSVALAAGRQIHRRKSSRTTRTNPRSCRLQVEISPSCPP